MSQFFTVLKIDLSMKYYFGVALAVAGLTFCLYQMFFHPLAKYPGPTLAKFTTARAAYYAWKGDVHLDIWLCHKKYGPIIRYAPNHLCFDTVTGLKEIYLSGKDLRKDKNMGKASSVPNLLTIVDRKEHARHRRLIGLGFSQSAMKRFNERLLHHVKSFCHAAYDAGLPEEPSGWSHPLTMSDWCSYLTFDVMADFIYGKSYDLIHRPDYRHLLKHIEESNLRTGVLLYCPQLYIGRLDRKLFPGAFTGNKVIHSFINQIIQERKSENGVGQNIYEQLGTQRKSTDHPLTPEEIRSEAMLLTIAGNDTTSTTLCAALFYLGKNLHAYEKLAAEIRSKFRVVDEIGQDKTLRNCHYLHGCIYESLRMSPPVGSSMWREVGPGGTSIDGEFIPCGYGVGTGIYSIHHNAEYFPRPHDFIPERWLSEKDGFICKEQADITSAAYIPFSAGTRACLGRHLAITELLAAIAALVLLYDFRISHTGNGELGSGHALGRNGRTNPGEFQLYDRVTSGKKGPILQLRSRKGN